MAPFGAITEFESFTRGISFAYAASSKNEFTTPATRTPAGHWHLVRV